MSSLSVEQSYRKLLRVIPQVKFPIDNAPELLRSVDRRVSALKANISCFLQKKQTEKRVYHADSDEYEKKSSEYLYFIFPLEEYAILKNLNEAVAFITSSLKASECYKDFQIDSRQRMELPANTLEFFHAHACGFSVKTEGWFGNGVYSNVFKKAHNQLSFACKEPSLSRNLPDNGKDLTRSDQEVYINIEAFVYSLLNHPNITRCLGYSTTPHQLRLEVVSSTLKTFLSNQIRTRNYFINVDPEVRLSICSELADALEYLHKKGIIHHDLKLDNVLLSDHNHVKLCDFGLAVSRENNDTIICTDYAAPETIRDDLLSEKLDVWAFAIIVRETLNLLHPYRSASQTSLEYRDWLFKEFYGKPADKSRLFKAEHKTEWDKRDPSELFRTLIASCLNGNPKERFSMRQVAQYFSDKKKEFHQAMNNSSD